MRTFEAALYSVAKQQIYFQQMLEQQAKTNTLYVVKTDLGKDSNGLYARVYYDNRNYFLVRPLMTLTYNDDGARTNRVQPTRRASGEVQSPPFLPPSFQEDVRVNYEGTTYVVGDPEGAIVTQNRTVFTILSFLFGQTAINTQNLPIQQLIRVQ
jgi:hypothetical protein